MVWLKIAVGMVIYHLLIGAAFAVIHFDVNPDIHGPKAYATVIVGWPLYAAATVAMDKRWNDTMTSIHETLGELNSGRWERFEKQHAK